MMSKKFQGLGLLVLLVLLGGTFASAEPIREGDTLYLVGGDTVDLHEVYDLKAAKFKMINGERPPKGKLSLNKHESVALEFEVEFARKKDAPRQFTMRGRADESVSVFTHAHFSVEGGEFLPVRKMEYVLDHCEYLDGELIPANCQDYVELIDWDALPFERKRAFIPSVEERESLQGIAELLNLLGAEGVSNPEIRLEDTLIAFVGEFVLAKQDTLALPSTMKIRSRIFFYFEESTEGFGWFRSKPKFQMYRCDGKKELECLEVKVEERDHRLTLDLDEQDEFALAYEDRLLRTLLRSEHTSAYIEDDMVILIERTQDHEFRVEFELRHLRGLMSLEEFKSRFPDTNFPPHYERTRAKDA